MEEGIKALLKAWLAPVLCELLHEALHPIIRDQARIIQRLDAIKLWEERMDQATQQALDELNQLTTAVGQDEANLEGQLQTANQALVVSEAANASLQAKLSQAGVDAATELNAIRQANSVLRTSHGNIATILGAGGATPGETTGSTDTGTGATTTPDTGTGTPDTTGSTPDTTVTPAPSPAPGDTSGAGDTGSVPVVPGPADAGGTAVVGQPVQPSGGSPAPGDTGGPA